jgi:hypothetical protein
LWSARLNKSKQYFSLIRSFRWGAIHKGKIKDSGNKIAKKSRHVKEADLESSNTPTYDQGANFVPNKYEFN